MSGGNRQASPSRGGLVWSVIAWGFICTSLALICSMVLPVAAVARLCGDQHGRWAHRFVGWGFRLMTRVYPVRVSVRGVAELGRYLREVGPAVICVNHESLTDIVYLYHLQSQAKWLAKRSLFRIPGFGWAMSLAHYIAVDRAAPDVDVDADRPPQVDNTAQVLRRVHDTLQIGLPVVCFPEGSRTAGVELGTFKRGPARMALAAGVPLIPVGLAGTGEILGKHSWRYRARGHVAIVVGAPIPTVGRRRGHARNLTEELRRQIVCLRQEAKRLRQSE